MRQDEKNKHRRKRGHETIGSRGDKEHPEGRISASPVTALWLATVAIAGLLHGSTIAAQIKTMPWEQPVVAGWQEVRRATKTAANFVSIVSTEAVLSTDQAFDNLLRGVSNLAEPLKSAKLPGLNLFDMGGEVLGAATSTENLNLWALFRGYLSSLFDLSGGYHDIPRRILEIEEAADRLLQEKIDQLSQQTEVRFTTVLTEQGEQIVTEVLEVKEGNFETVSVSGSSALQDTLTVGGLATIDALEVLNSLNVRNTLDTLNERVTVSQNLDATAGLDVSGSYLTVGGANFVVDPQTGGLTVQGNTYLGQNLTIDTNALVVDAASDRVGLGTTGPGYRLDVQGGDINTSGVYRQGGTNVGQTVSCVAGNTFSGLTISGGILSASGSCVAIGPGATTLQQAYDAGNTITTADNRDILVTLADTTTDSDFIINMQGTGNIFQVQDGGVGVFTIGDGGTATIETDQAAGFRVTSLSGSPRLIVDSNANRVGIGVVPSSGQLEVNVSMAVPSRPGIIVLGAPSQTGNLQEWQSSAGTSLAWITSAGSLEVQNDSSTALRVRSTAGSPRLVVDSNSNRVGIGLTPTAGQLEVLTASAARQALILRAAVSQTANIQEWQDSSGTVLSRISGAGSLIFDGANSGIGIGLAGGSRNAQLDVRTGAAGNIGLIVQGAAFQTADLLRVQNSAGTVMVSIGATGSTLYKPTSDSTTAFQIQPSASTTPVLNVNTTNSRVGIGTAAPASILDIKSGALYRNTSGSGFTAGAEVIQIRDDTEAVLNLISDVDTAGAQFGSIWFTRSGGQSDNHQNIAGIRAIQKSTGILTGADLSFVVKQNAAPFEALRIDAANTITANVGINTSPLARLHVSASVGPDALFRVTDATATAVDVLNIADEGATLFKNRTNSTTAFQIQPSASTTPVFNVDTTNSRVGIGTASPAKRLHVELTSGIEEDALHVTTAGTNWFRVRNASDNNRFLYFSGMTLLGAMTAPSTWPAETLFVTPRSASVIGLTVKGQSNQTADLFQIRSSGNVSATGDLFVINNTGNVGIGTTSPTGRLHLAGDISASSWTTAGIQLQGAAATYTDTSGSGTIATRVGSSIAQPTLASSNAVTLTDAATFYIAGAPIAGTNTTITNAQALRVDTGAAASMGLVVRGAASQSANLQQWQNSAGTVLSSINAAGALTIGQSGTAITRHLSGTTSLNASAPGAVPGCSSDLTLTVTNAALGDTVTLGTPVTWPAGFLVNAWVSAANTVSIRWCQFSGAAADPDGAGGTYRADVWQH